MRAQLSVIDDLWVALAAHGSDVLLTLVQVHGKRFASEPGAAELGVPSRGMVAFLLGAGRKGVGPAGYSAFLRRDHEAEKEQRSIERHVAGQVAGGRRFYVDDLIDIAESAGLPTPEVVRLTERVLAEPPIGDDYCFPYLSVEHVVAVLNEERPAGARLQMPSQIGRPSGFSRDRPIFAQFINPEFLQLHNQSELLLDPGACRRRLERVARMAVLASRAGLVLPASYLFEVPGVADFVGHASALTEVGAIQLTAPAAGLAEYRETKLSEYREEASNNPYLDTSFAGGIQTVQWRPRHGTTAGQTIARAWARETRRESSLFGVVRTVASVDGLTMARAGRRVAQMPERLDGRALVSKYVLAALPSRLAPADRQAVRWLLSSKYLESYLEDLDAMVLVNFDFGSFSSPGGSEREISAIRLQQIFRLLGLDAKTPTAEANWDAVVLTRDSMELDILLTGLYDEMGSFEWWKAATGFRRRTAPPSMYNDPTGYIAWLGDLIASL